jgi:hypothetical protein
MIDEEHPMWRVAWRIFIKKHCPSRGFRYCAKCEFYRAKPRKGQSPCGHPMHPSNANLEDYVLEEL